MTKRKRLIIVCLALVLIAAACLFVFSSGQTAIPVTLLGYTNDMTGIAATSYESSNVAHSGFAIFRADNPTAQDFLCYIGPVIIGAQSNRMQHAQTGDFTLPAEGAPLLQCPHRPFAAPGSAAFISSANSISPVSNMSFAGWHSDAACTTSTDLHLP